MNTKSISRITGVLYVSSGLVYLVSHQLLKEQLVDTGDIAGTLKLLTDSAFRYRLAVSIDLLAMAAVMALVVDLPEGAKVGTMLPLVSFELILGLYLAVFGIREEAA